VECHDLVKIVQEKRIADEQRAEVEETSQRIALEVRIWRAVDNGGLRHTRNMIFALQEGKCKRLQTDAEADLALALPALEKAMLEVESLTLHRF